MDIFDGLKSAGKVLHEAGKIEQYQQILDALQKLLEMQKKIGELEAGNKKLREDFEIKENLFFEGNMYWFRKDDIKDGPFFFFFWDFERNLVRLHKRVGDDRTYCPKCNTVAKSGTEVHQFKPSYRGFNRGK